MDLFFYIFEDFDFLFRKVFSWYNFVFDLRVASDLLSKIVPIPNLCFNLFSILSIRFPRKPFQFRHSKICKEAKISFMINPITFVTYLKLTLKRFPKMINFWLKQLSRLLLPFSRKKKNVNKHKKNVISFIVDIVSYRCTTEPLQMLFRKNSPWQIVGFNSFSGFLLLFQ